MDCIDRIDRFDQGKDHLSRGQEASQNWSKSDIGTSSGCRVAAGATAAQDPQEQSQELRMGQTDSSECHRLGKSLFVMSGMNNWRFGKDRALIRSLPAVRPVDQELLILLGYTGRRKYLVCVPDSSRASELLRSFNAPISFRWRSVRRVLLPPITHDVFVVESVANDQKVSSLLI